MLADLISRVVALSGVKVTLIQNITDVGHMADDFEAEDEELVEVEVLLLLPPQLYTKYVPSAETLFTGSLPSGHDPAKLWTEKNDRVKSKSIFFIK